MTKRSISVCVCISVLLISAYLSGKPKIRSSYDLSTRTLDAESRLTIGRGVTLSSSTQAELELIPGISQNLSTEILAKKPQILSRALKSTKREQHKALESINGIGEKTATRLNGYIELK